MDSPSTPPASGKPKQGFLSVAGYIGFLALTLSIVAIITIAIGWQKYRTSTTLLENKIVKLQQSFSQSNAILQENQAAIVNNQKNISALMAQGNQTTQQIVFSEVAYLIRLAHVQLVINNNVSASLQLLKMAQTELQTLVTPTATTLALALKQDIDTLTQLPAIDTTTVVLALDRLNREIDTLSFTPPHSPTVTTLAIPSSSQSQWDRIKENLARLQHLFIIQHINSTTVPLLDPQQMLFLKEKIHLKLFEAEWAVLQRQPTLYQHSLTTVASWLSQYDQNRTDLAPLLKNIQTLAVIPIQPTWPALQSLSTLESLAAPSSTLKTTP